MRKHPLWRCTAPISSADRSASAELHREQPRYFGIGNYDEAGFKFMEEAIPLSLAMFKMSIRTRPEDRHGHGRHAGAHGQNAREIVYRVQMGGQAAMDAIIGATSLNAEALGLKDRIGSLAAGMEADLIAVDGDPLTDITALPTGDVRDERRQGLQGRYAQPIR